MWVSRRTVMGARGGLCATSPCVLEAHKCHSHGCDALGQPQGVDSDGRWLRGQQGAEEGCGRLA